MKARILTWLCLCLAAGWIPLRASAASHAAQTPPPYLLNEATVVLSIDDVEGTVAELKVLARAVGGRFVDDEFQISVLPDGLREVKTSLELPPEMLDTALARLRTMALSVRHEKVERQDVSSQINELQAILERHTASRRRLRGLLDETSSEHERSQIESQINIIQTAIVSVEAQLGQLRYMTNWAVIHILAHEIAPTPTAVPATPTFTPTLAPPTATPTPAVWRPGKTVHQASGVLFGLLRTLADWLIVFGILCGPVLALGLTAWGVFQVIKR